MKTFTYNEDICGQGLHDIVNSKEFAATPGKWVFLTYHPAFCSGFDDTLVVFDSLKDFEGVRREVWKDETAIPVRNCMYGLFKDRKNEYTLMVFHKHGAPEGKESQHHEFSRQHTGLPDYCEWYVLGFVYRKMDLQARRVGWPGYRRLKYWDRHGRPIPENMPYVLFIGDGVIKG